MGEFLDKYGGVIVGVICIVALAALATAVFTSSPDEGIGKQMVDQINSITAV